MKWVLGIMAVIIGSMGLPVMVWAQQTTDPTPCGPWQMMHNWGVGSGWGGMGLGSLLMIVWLALLVAVIVLVIRWLGGMSGAIRIPREILDERFAKGEIDQDEYEKRRKALGS